MAGIGPSTPDFSRSFELLRPGLTTRRPKSRSDLNPSLRPRNLSGSVIHTNAVMPVVLVRLIVHRGRRIERMKAYSNSGGFCIF
ncbi:hypothetical protein RchiOBHm_Chr4g0406511 [Rosa chinensis]|uniref:Uncharacterized protein n=1 Tax=Rosa chinensis TaxID=74649 RepID=A0A2P6QUC0_ROSCH|nr:hypothetical protein RchiOBHm_Chr4g0406511 [Rosa chinensis]